MNALTILLLKLDTISGEVPSSVQKKLCVELCRTLHERDPEMIIIHEDLQSYYSEFNDSKGRGAN